MQSPRGARVQAERAHADSPYTPNSASRDVIGGSVKRRTRRSVCVTLCLLIVSLTACRSTWIDEELDRRHRELYGATRSNAAGRQTDVEDASPPPPSAEESDLASYLRYGLAMNAGLRAAFDKWRSAMEVIPQVTALPDPRFTFGQFVESIETRTGPQENTFGLSQTFPWFGKLEARGEVQAQEANRLWAIVTGRRLAVEREIRDAFHEYAYLAEAVRISEDNLALLKRLEPVVQRKIQGGAGQDDLLRLQVEIGKIENDLETLKKFRGPLSSRLRAVMNWRGSDLLPWPKRQEAIPRAVKTETLRGLLLQENPELAALREEVKKQAAAIELAELEGWPDFTLGANYIATDSARMSGVSGSGDDPLLFTLSFNIPIQRGKYDAAIREARAARASALGALRQKENDLFATLDLEAYKLDDAMRQIALYRDSLLPRARQALEVTEVSYRGGTATLTDLIDSQRVLLAFEKAFERARADYEQAVATLEALCGGRIR